MEEATDRKEPMAALTQKQVDELNMTLRHLARALKSFERANLPARDPGAYRGWLSALERGGLAIAAASDKIIDGLEGRSS